MSDCRSWTPEQWAERRLTLNQRRRAAFLAGVERHWRAVYGRGMTVEELETVIRDYEGDLPERLPADTLNEES